MEPKHGDLEDVVPFLMDDFQVPFWGKNIIFSEGSSPKKPHKLAL